MSGGLTIGLNQYTHSASACLLDGEGEPLFALSKERITRKKFDGGDTAELVRHLLEQCNASISDLRLVVANNHLFRIDEFESTLDWAQALDQYRPSYLDRNNLLPGIEKLELSHHLAHAWSVLPICQFDRGLIVVMDGIGTTFEALHRPGENYFSDAGLASAEYYAESPPAEHRNNGKGWREGESAFQFEGLELERVFKRWICEHTPTLLYNYGFENMESLGAVYSRVSSHIFGDWNACGKVMGMAPWAPQWAAQQAPDWVMRGPLAELEVNWERLRSAPQAAQWGEEDARPMQAALAADVQRDLEQIALDFLRGLREQSGEKNICLVGGVALNCAMNGRIAREAGFENVFIPPWPGDEGLAIGCALFGHHYLHPRAQARRTPFTPFLGTEFTEQDQLADINEFEAWVECYLSDDVVAATAEALSKGEVVAWFQGRAEFGQRALGNRSILADPRDGGMIERINSAIKKREGFRPFAPTVLAEHADDWFESPGSSDYMSRTAQCRSDKVPAVTHVDGSSRIQTLDENTNPRFRRLIELFNQHTGIPMVLNTSFNLAGEPLVETPADALRTFLDSDLDLLVLGDYLIRKQSWPSDGKLHPCHLPANAEMVSDQDGEPLSVRFMAAGRTLDSDSLQLGLWEACTGENTRDEIIEYFVSEHGEDKSECEQSLQQLWRWRLIKFSAND